MMVLVGVEHETFVSEQDALTTRLTFTFYVLIHLNNSVMFLYSSQ